MGHRDPLRAQLTRSSTFETVYSTLLEVGTPPVPVRSSSTPSRRDSDDVVDDAFSDMLRHAMLVAEVLHEKTLLLAAALPRRSREAVDIMVVIGRGAALCDVEFTLLSLLFLLSVACRRSVAGSCVARRQNQKSKTKSKTKKSKSIMIMFTR